MKGKMNPPLEMGDEIILYHMEGESSVSPGTKGIVTKIEQDPFERESKIISVKWENGSQLSLLSATDFWKKSIPSINEDRQFDYFSNNPEIFENFDWRFLSDYLSKVRESGIVNMFGASPLLYAGKDHIERYYGEGREDDEDFQNVLELAEEAKNKMIQGTLKWMKKNNKELDIDNVNIYIKKLSNKVWGLFANFMH